MATNGEGWFADGYWATGYWHTGYWCETGTGTVVVSEEDLRVPVHPIHAKIPTLFQPNLAFELLKGFRYEYQMG